MIQWYKTGVIRSQKNAQEVFKDIFGKVIILAGHFYTEIKMPRLSNRQIHWNDVSASSPGNFYITSIFIPYLDKFISELDNGFINHQVTLSNFHSLFQENGYLEDFKNYSYWGFTGKRIFQHLNQNTSYGKENSCKQIINQKILWRL